MINSRGFHLYDPNFQSQQSAKCDLLIRISTHRISYAIVDQLQDQLRVIYDTPFNENIEENFEEIFHDDPFLKFRFRKVKVGIESRKFTFIPSDVYSENLISAYSAFFSPNEDEEVLVNHLRNSRVRNVLAPPAGLLKLMRTHFASPAIFSQAEPMMESFLKFYFKPMGLQLFLQFNDQSFEALVTEGKKVILYNIYDQATPDEFNYFLLNILQQAAISPENVPAIISGIISEGDENHQRLQKYFPDIVFASSTKLIHVSGQFQQLPGHRFYSLLSLNICE